MNIAIIGTGYVGLVTGTCLTNFGLSVTCVDKDKKKIDLLKKGEMPIYEPGLKELIFKNVKENRLKFTTDLKKAVEESQVIYIAVGTPQRHDGSANLQQVERVAKDIGKYINGYKVIVNKCTVPVGIARKIKQIISDNYDDTHISNHYEPPSSGHCEEPPSSGHCEERNDEAIPSNSAQDGISKKHKDSPSNCDDLSSDFHYENAHHQKQSEFASSSLRATKGSAEISSSSSYPSPLRENSPHIPSPLRGEGRVRVKYSFDIISNPEFLREGSAVYDFTHPDKIVIGYESEKAKMIMQEIYRPLYLLDTPFVFTTLETAEMIKYACNAFLATKITFINEIANLCDRVGADVYQIAKAMGMDGRISPKFLHPGPGYGGSCFPKDTRALQVIANDYNYDFKLIKAVIEVNCRQRKIVVEKIEKSLCSLSGKTIGILGLAFKQNTDDIRESAAIDIIKMLLQKGAIISCFDPLATENTQKILPELTYCQDEYEAAKNADALVILTEWNQFRNLDLSKIKNSMKNNFLFDIKNLYEPSKVKELGFKYLGMGRS
ncbi:MAG: UDP-glucose/GDP-mannose dehydrogenase family protein [Atribacterota bacterium]|nr:UDP-glucose/GDP-mannose dehydrogenase family protein [Atribacterota bacterium]